MLDIKDTAELLVINSFVLNGSGGNPAGVVLNLPGHLRNQRVMQKIAAVAGFSETVFLENPESGSEDLRFFTPENEIDFCGHATLAMFFALRAAGMLKEPVACFSTGVGSIKVHEKSSGEIMMQQVLPEFKQKFEMMEICDELGLSSSHIEKSLLPPQIVSTGVPDLILQISCIEHLENLKFSPEALKRFSGRTGSAGMHAFSIIEKGEIWEIAARNFAPLFGISEESATGSASGALACYLYRHCAEAPTRFRFLQGQFMGLPSEIKVEVETAGESIVKVMVGGRAAFIKKMELNVAGL